MNLRAISFLLIASGISLFFTLLCKQPAVEKSPVFETGEEYSFQAPDLEEESSFYQNLEEEDVVLIQEPDPVETKKPEEEKKITKAVYLTGYSASSSSMLDYVAGLSETAGVNAVVIDVKDWSGNVFYRTGVEEVERYGAHKILISDIDSLIEKFHQKDILVIARIALFQDPILANARNDLALHSKSSADLWLDNKGIAWVDPSSKEVWNYNVAIAQDCLSSGFDEINFDYLRFPSDGDLLDISYPVWDFSKTRSQVIKSFYQYLREKMPNAVLSADLFGLSCTSYDDLGIGQVIEDAFPYFDYVCPMVYPSHYADGFLGFENPAQYPYQVVEYSTRMAGERLLRSDDVKAKIRPWLQDFDLGAEYDAIKVWLQIEAVKAGLGENYSGFMLWSPRNIYTVQALNLSE